jgi:hypothetical protein
MPRPRKIRSRFTPTSTCRNRPPSLRANGSRECAPDDRLREAIQRQKPRRNSGLLRRYAPRNDGRIRVRIPAAQMAPEFCMIRSPEKTRAWGMPGAQSTRSLACEIKKHTSVVTARSTGKTRHSRTQWFYGFLRALPDDRALLPPSLAEHRPQA